MTACTYCGAIDAHQSWCPSVKIDDLEDTVFDLRARVAELEADANRLHRTLSAITQWRDDVQRNPNVWQESSYPDDSITGAIERKAYAEGVRTAEMQIASLVSRAALEQS